MPQSLKSTIWDKNNCNRDSIKDAHKGCCVSVNIYSMKNEKFVSYVFGGKTYSMVKKVVHQGMNI
jgi:hypothetical protein